MKTLKTVAANSATETNTKVESSMTTKRAGYMRDVSDEEQNSNDIIGIMLRGSDLDMEVLITYNRQTNTFHQNYNSSVVSEKDIVTSVWKTLTPLGMIKVRLLRDFYEQKQPSELRDLAEKLQKGEAPEALPNLNGPGVIEHIPNPGGVDQDRVLMYDLDNMHLSSVVVTASRRTVKADVDLGSGDDFITTHSYIEQALTQTGFNFVMQEKTRDFYRYLVTFRGESLQRIDAGSTDDINDISEAIEMAVGTLGWNIEAASFPAVNDQGQLTWMAAGAGCGIRVNSAESVIEFYRID